MRTLVLVVSRFLLEIPIVQVQSASFEGKTIRIVTGYPAGDINDMWPRLIAQHMTKYISGTQNMPGASSMIAANYVFTAAKPDELTLGWISPTLYVDQLVGRNRCNTALSVPSRRANIAFTCAPTVRKNDQRVRKSNEPTKFGSGGAAGTGFYFPRLVGAKFYLVLE